MELTKIPELLKSEGVLLASIPFAGTLIGFVFEVGYVSYYDVPISLIRIDFNRIVASTALVSVSFVFLHICLTWVAFLKLSGNAVLRALFKPLFTSLIFFALIYGFPDAPFVWMLPIGIFFSLLILNLFPPFFSRNSSEKYIERLSSHLKVMEGTERSAEIDASTVMGLLFFGSIIVLGIGRNFAIEKQSYWVNEQYPNMIVVEFYGDIAILKEYDNKTNELLENMLIIDTKPQNGYLYNKLKTGNLTNNIK